MIKVNVPNQQVETGVIRLAPQCAMNIHVHQADFAFESSNFNSGHAIVASGGDLCPVNGDPARAGQIQRYSRSSFPPTVSCQKSGILLYGQSCELTSVAGSPGRPLSLLHKTASCNIIPVR